MELRSTEEELESMAVKYKSLCQADSRLVALEENVEAAADDVARDVVSPLLQAETILSAADVLSALESLKEQLDSIKPRMERFQKRLQEKDPITEKPRYGEKTASRVKSVLFTYDALTQAIQAAFHNTQDSNDATVVEELRSVVAKQQELARKETLAKQELEQNQREQDNLLEEKRRQEEEKLQRQQQLAKAQEEAELSRRAQELREKRQEEERRALELEQQRRREQEQRDREWMDSVQKGPDGVRQQIECLKQSTADEPGAFATALGALHTLFSQIVAHPEQVNFRRVRKHHPKFHQDIGRHQGGREFLIAAGFRLDAIDGVPCFISTEPDIETQMDEWSDWFDLLKATVEILEQELINS